MCLSMHVCLLIIVVCFLMKRLHGLFGIVCAVHPVGSFFCRI